MMLLLKSPDITPSITKQTPWPCGFYEFPKRYKVQYFNPGLVDWQQSRWLVTRRRRCAVAPGRNDITLWRLSTENTLISEHPLKLPSVRQDEHYEDPRAINVNGQLWVSYSNFYTRGHWVHQAIARVNPLLQGTSVCHPVFGDNRESIRENVGHEKNWLWFSPHDPQAHEGRLLMIYSAWPHTTVRFDERRPKVWTGKGFRWSKGQVRGGTPPFYVAADDLYWTFFHSSVDISPTPPRRRYYMGAYAFESKPPFAMVRRTAKPILTGSDQDPRDEGAPLCVFPCGALLTGNTWHVTLGVNDCNCAWMMIPHNELWDATIKIR